MKNPILISHVLMIYSRNLIRQTPVIWIVNYPDKSFESILEETVD